MRILRIIPYTDRGGGALAAATLLRALADAGVEQSVLQMTSSSGLDSSPLGIRNQNRFYRWENRFWRELETRLCLPGALNLSDLQGGKKALGGKPFDIIHLHVTHTVQLGWPFLRWLSSRGKIVWTLHDLWPLTGNCIYPMECEKWKTNCSACPQLDAYPPLRRDTTPFLHRQKKKLIASMRPHFVAPSKWIEPLSIRHLRSLGADLTVIPHGIDTSLFKPGGNTGVRKKLGIPENAHAIFLPTARKDDSRKGTGLFSELLPLLAASTHPLYIFYVKSNVQQPTPVSVETSANLKIIEVPYALSNEEMRDYYNACDVTLTFSAVETFGRCVAESLACGKAVFGFDAPGINELVDQKILGALVKYGDVRALATEILRHFQDRMPEESQQRHKIMHERHGLSKHAQGHLDLYSRLVRERS